MAKSIIPVRGPPATLDGNAELGSADAKGTRKPASRSYPNVPHGRSWPAAATELHP
jgi:hypothetical protein